MTFTDDDIKRMWIEINGAYPPEIGVSRLQLQALLARLEAAESIVESHIEMSKYCGDCHSCCGDEDDDGVLIHEKDCETMEEIEAWRKAAGK